MPFRARSLRIDRGGRTILSVESLALPGEGAISFGGGNGAGKTTLLEAFAGLLPFRGELSLGDRPLPASGHRDRELRHEIAYLPAAPHLFALTAVQNVALPLLARGVSHAEAESRAREELERAGLLALAGRPAKSLSTGEGKRVALARALVTTPRILILDEPTAHIDGGSVRALLDRLRDFAERPGRALLYATHDLPLALALAARRYSVHEGTLHPGAHANHIEGRFVDPEAIALLPCADPRATRQGRVVATALLDRRVLVTIETGDERLVALLPAQAAPPPPGATAGIMIRSETI